MTQLPNISEASSGNQPFGSQNTLNDLNLNDFLDLMLTELQNQDPLNPLENDKLIAQIGQIRSIGATDKLSETLDSVLLGQSISSATNLIGADIEAISDDNQRVSGIVDRVSIANGSPKLHLNLGPKVRPSEDPGEIEAGTYQYRVVWSDGEGGRVAIDPVASDGIEGGAIQLAEDGKSVLVSGLPVTAVGKQVYRTDGTGTGNFRLVGTLSDGSESTFLDTTSDADLSQTVLNGNPALLDNSERSFTVSLSNVGEIRPPRR